MKDDKQIRGIVAGAYVDREGDLFKMEVVDHIVETAVGKPVYLNFNPSQHVGNVKSARLIANVGVEVVVDIIDDETWDKIEVGRGLGVGGIVKESKNYPSSNVHVIKDFDLLEVSLVDIPAHDSWKVTGKTFIKWHCDEDWVYYDNITPKWNYDAYEYQGFDIVFKETMHPKFCPNCGEFLPVFIDVKCSGCGDHMEVVTPKEETRFYCSDTCFWRSTD